MVKVGEMVAYKQEGRPARRQELTPRDATANPHECEPGGVRLDEHEPCETVRLLGNPLFGEEGRGENPEDEQEREHRGKVQKEKEGSKRRVRRCKESGQNRADKRRDQ